MSTTCLSASPSLHTSKGKAWDTTVHYQFSQIIPPPKVVLSGLPLNVDVTCDSWCVVSQPGLCVCAQRRVPTYRQSSCSGINRCHQSTDAMAIVVGNCGNFCLTFGDFLAIRIWWHSLCGINGPILMELTSHMWLKVDVFMVYSPWRAVYDGI